MGEPASRGGQAKDFVKRAREAVTAQGLNADVVEYYLLPSSAIGSEVIQMLLGAFKACIQLELFIEHFKRSTLHTASIQPSFLEENQYEPKTTLQAVHCLKIVPFNGLFLHAGPYRG